mmetsp:Transcript_19860/g.61600  ORF Transcript_19860/g.61600 Transcript_19860/m.61600 type:complete len:214 (+) Transcript_19860:859-1500(+)
MSCRGMHAIPCGSCRQHGSTCSMEARLESRRMAAGESTTCTCGLAAANASKSRSHASIELPWLSRTLCITTSKGPCEASGLEPSIRRNSMPRARAWHNRSSCKKLLAFFSVSLKPTTTRTALLSAHGSWASLPPVPSSVQRSSAPWPRPSPPASPAGCMVPSALLYAQRSAPTSWPRARRAHATMRQRHASREGGRWRLCALAVLADAVCLFV